MGQSAQRPWSTVRRLAAVGVLAAVLSPAVTNHDSFPLSTLPVAAAAGLATNQLWPVV